MAKLVGPLLSLRASGDIGGAIVYSSWKGIQYAKKHTTPANPNTADQQEVRGIFRTIIGTYKILPSIAREPWIASVRGRSLTAPNRFSQENLPALQPPNDLRAIIMSVASGQAIPPDNVSGARTGGNQVTISADAPTPPVGYSFTALQAAVIHYQFVITNIPTWALADEDTTAPYEIIINAPTGPPWIWTCWAKWTRDSDGRAFYSTPISGYHV